LYLLSLISTSPGSCDQMDDLVVSIVPDIHHTWQQ
jgi:hypothetical protein